jgi:hypothetical protein
MALYKTETYVGVDEYIIEVKVRCIALVCKQWRNLKFVLYFIVRSVYLNFNAWYKKWDRDSSVGIATR